MDVSLRTATGEVIRELTVPLTVPIGQRSPDVLLWGGRTFCNRGTDTRNREVYYEANRVYTIDDPPCPSPSST